MKKISDFFAIFFLFVFVNSLQPGSRINLNSSILEQIKDYLVPLVDKKLGNVTLNNYTKKIPLIEVNITNSHFLMSPIQLSNVEINFKNLSTKTEVRVKEIFGNFSMDLNYDLGGIKDFIHCDAILKEMYIISEITNDINKTGSPLAKVSAKLNMEPFKATLIFRGGISAKLLELLEPIIKIFIVEATDLGINSQLHKWIADEINSLISTFVVNFEIANKIYVNYELILPPTYLNHFLSIPLSGYGYYEGKKFPPISPPSPVPIYDDSINISAQFVVSEYLVNSVLQSCYDNNILFMNFEYGILPFSMNLSCNASKVPFVALNEDINANLSFYCNVSALNTTDQTTHLFQAYGLIDFNVSFVYTKTGIQFYIVLPNLISLSVEHPVEFNVDWFINAADGIASYASSEISYGFLLHTIPFPVMNHVTYNPLVVKRLLHNFIVPSDLNIK